MKLGKLSAKYESSGDPLTVSSGEDDMGGVSYGIYQFSSEMGVAQAFVEWCNSVKGFYVTLDTWKEVEDVERFAELQHEYVKSLYYDRAVALLAELGFYIVNRSNALNDVLWSRSVQFHPRWMPELFQDAADLAGKSLEECSDEELIYNIYEVNLTDMSWSSGSPNLRYGLFNRWRNEREDALNMLKEEIGNG